MLKFVIGFVLLLGTQALKGWAPGTEDCLRRIPGSQKCSSCWGGFALKDGQCEAVYESNLRYLFAYFKCKTMNKVTQLCNQCLSIYENVDGRCQKKKVSLPEEKQKVDEKQEKVEKVMIQGCEEAANNKCMRCAHRYALIDGGCKKVDDSCDDYSEVTALCLTCIEGYTLEDVKCVMAETEEKDVEKNPIIDKGMMQGCAQPGNNQCMRCAHRYALIDGGCKKADDMCDDYSEVTALCLTCYKEYTLDDGKCVMIETEEKDVEKNPIIDKGMMQGCAQPGNNQCMRCAHRYALIDGGCKKADDMCDDYSEVTALCLTCYKEYTLDDGKCVMIETEEKDVEKNPIIDKGMMQGCAQPGNNQCMRCAHRYALIDGGCKKADDMCDDYSEVTALCLTCYKEYTLDDGKCVMAETVVIPEVKEKEEEECIDYVVDDGCETWDENTGQCFTCLKGYYLKEETCAQKTSKKGGYQQSNCHKYNSQGYCVVCSGGYFMIEGTCSFAYTDCLTLDSETGLCTSCRTGDAMIGQGKCVQASTIAEKEDKVEDKGHKQISREGCETWDLETRTCLNCIDRYYLMDGKCIANKMEGCGEFKDGKCMRCYYMFFMTDENNCYTVDPMCSFFDKTKQMCKECYAGYTIDEGLCTRQM